MVVVVRMQTWPMNKKIAMKSNLCSVIQHSFQISWNEHILNVMVGVHEGDSSESDVGYIKQKNLPKYRDKTYYIMCHFFQWPSWGMIVACRGKDRQENLHDISNGRIKETKLQY